MAQERSLFIFIFIFISIFMSISIYGTGLLLLQKIRDLDNRQSCRQNEPYRAAGRAGDVGAQTHFVSREKISKTVKADPGDPDLRRLSQSSRKRDGRCAKATFATPVPRLPWRRDLRRLPGKKVCGDLVGRWHAISTGWLFR